jgi:hypothetical protein
MSKFGKDSWYPDRDLNRAPPVTTRRTYSVSRNICYFTVQSISFNFLQQIRQNVCCNICSTSTAPIRPPLYEIVLFNFFNFFLIWIVGGGVQVGPLGTAATNKPTVPTLGDYDDGEFSGIMIGKGNRSTRGKKTCPSSTLSTTNPTYCARARTLAAAVGSQRLKSCWPMARPTSLAHKNRR